MLNFSESMPEISVSTPHQATPQTSSSGWPRHPILSIRSIRNLSAPTPSLASSGSDASPRGNQRKTTLRSTESSGRSGAAGAICIMWIKQIARLAAGRKSYSYRSFPRIWWRGGPVWEHILKTKSNDCQNIDMALFNRNLNNMVPKNLQLISLTAYVTFFIRKYK